MDTSPRPLRLSIVTKLSHEWRHLARQPRAIARANQWNLPGGPIDHLDVVLERCGFDQPGNFDHHDDYLSDVTRRAGHDDLAARIVLQRIIPGLVSIAVRRAPITPNGLDGAFDVIVSAAWLVIRQYPIDRRPHRVAANILMDIEYLAFVRNGRLKSHSHEDVTHPEGMLGVEFSRFRVGDLAQDPVAEELAFEILLYSLSENGLDERDMQMLRAVGNGINSIEASTVLGISPRSVRNRRENALRRARVILDGGDGEIQRSGSSS